VTKDSSLSSLRRVTTHWASQTKSRELLTFDSNEKIQKRSEYISQMNSTRERGPDKNSSNREIWWVDNKRAIEVFINILINWSLRSGICKNIWYNEIFDQSDGLLVRSQSEVSEEYVLSPFYNLWCVCVGYLHRFFFLCNKCCCCCCCCRRCRSAVFFQDTMKIKESRNDYTKDPTNYWSKQSIRKNFQTEMLYLRWLYQIREDLNNLYISCADLRDKNSTYPNPRESKYWTQCCCLEYHRIYESI
jgi:hypothetical protein